MAGKKALRVGAFRGAVTAPEPVARVSVKVGALKASSRGVSSARGTRQCTVCVGSYHHGNWMHDLECPETIVQYNVETVQSRSNVRGGVWPCPFHCTPTPLTFGRTHHHACMFWETRIHAHPL